MVKVFAPNKDGKIEFTRDELERLLNEVWQDGKIAGNYYWQSPNWYGSTTPTITTITKDEITLSAGGTNGTD